MPSRRPEQARRYNRLTEIKKQSKNHLVSIETNIFVAKSIHRRDFLPFILLDNNTLVLLKEKNNSSIGIFKATLEPKLLAQPMVSHMEQVATNVLRESFKKYVEKCFSLTRYADEYF